MDNKSILKGTSRAFLLFTLIICSLLFIQITYSSQFSIKAEETSYNQGDSVYLFVFGIPRVYYEVIISGPQTFKRLGITDKNGQDYLIFDLDKPGNYTADIIYNGTIMDTTYFQIKEVEKETDIFEEEFVDKSVNYLQTPEINKPVKWIRKIKAIDEISAKKFLPQDSFNSKIRQIDLDLYEAEYETPAPFKEELLIKPFILGEKFKKLVKVKSDSLEHYENVKVYTDIPEELSSQGYFIRLYHVKGTRIDVTNDPIYNVSFLDTDNNGLTDRIEWNVPHLSEEQFEVEADIAIINVQSYPSLYGNWTVRFITNGTANLTIRAIDGTEFGRDIEFLELRCGNNILTTETTNGVIFVENYSCDETGYEISKVLIAGKHTLEFRFGDDVEYAYNSPDSLIVNLSYPSPDIYTSSNPLEVIQYNTFQVNATVKCEGGDCGEVYGSVRYNDSTSTMKLINISALGTPFYIVEPKELDNETYTLIQHPNPGGGTGDVFGISVSYAGDINNDSYADVIIGAYLDDIVCESCGSAFIFYGSQSGLDNTTYTLIKDPNVEQTNQDYFGSSVSYAGDVNKDGYADVIIGAYFDDIACFDCGSAFIFYGSQSGLDNTTFTLIKDPNVESDFPDYFGYSVSYAGDVNNDSYADVIIGAQEDDIACDQCGSAFIFYGNQSGLDNTTYTLIQHPNPGGGGDRFGTSVSYAGDINNDSYADVIIGAIYDDIVDTNCGAAYVFYGSQSGLDNTTYTLIKNPNLNSTTGDEFGYSVSYAGDINNDSYADVIIGAYLDDIVCESCGSAFIFYGSQSGLDNTTYTLIKNPNLNSTSGDEFGYSVSYAGDVNKDGYPDVIIGARYDDIVCDYCGSAFIFYGSQSGLDNTTYTLIQDPNVESSDIDIFGRSVSYAGDINNDDYADVIIGAPYDDIVCDNCGIAFIYSHKAQNPQSCGALSDGDQCNLTWTINTTGTINDVYRIDANFSSNPQNDTNDAYVKITSGEDTTPPQIEFVPPTPDDGDSTPNNWVYLNTTITDDSNTSAFFDWNYSLVGYWSFDWHNSSGIFDNSTWNNFGTFNGGLGEDNITTGEYGKALRFDGSNDYVFISDDPSLNVSSAATVECWVKVIASSGAANVPRIFHRTVYWGIGIAGKDGTPLGATEKEIIFTQFDGGWQLTGYVPDSGWHHIAEVYNGSHILFYIDGILNKTVSPDGTPPTGNIYFGSTHVPSEYFNGSIDEVRLHKRVLTPEEINASYNNGLYRLYHNFTGLTDATYDYYTYAIDSLGNANKTATRNITVNTTDVSPPIITWEDPTPDDGDTTSNNWVYLNTTITDDSDTSAFFDWNYSLVGYWNFEEGSGDYANDTSTYGNNGTLTYHNFTSTAGHSDTNGTQCVDDDTLDLINDTYNGWTFKATSGAANGQLTTITDYIYYSSSYRILYFETELSGFSQYDEYLLYPDFEGPSWTTGKSGDALEFDGENDYVNISDNPSLDITNTLTIEAWIKAKQVPRSQHELIVDKQVSANSGYRLATRKSGSNVVLQFGTYNGTGYNELNSISTISLNEWHHVVGTWDGTTKKIYIDGELDTNSANWGGPIVANDLDVLIGTDESFLSRFYFNGSIDEVKIWNRSLSAEEINTSYNNGLYRLKNNFTSLSDGTYYYYVYAIDTEGNANKTAIRNVTVDTTGDTTPPQIQFVPPTPDDGNVTENDWTYVNVSVSDSSNTSSFIDWNYSLVGYWSMDWYNSSGIFDNSTNNNFGTFNGGLGEDNITNAKYGKGLEFDGVDDFINCSYDESLNLTDEFTIEAWFKGDSFGESGTYRAIVGRSVGGATADWSFTLNFAPNDKKIAGGISDGSHEGWVQATQDLSTGVWYHVAFVMNSSHLVLYVNGTLTGTPEARDYTPQGTNFPLYIGMFDPDSSTTNWNGTIDEVRIYNRELSPEEIKASYNNSLYRLYHNFTGLTNGTYYYSAYTIDTEGNANKTATRNVTVDTTGGTTPPTISVISPLNQTYYNQNWVWTNVTTNKAAEWCGVSLNDTANQTLSNTSTTDRYLNLTVPTEGSNNVKFYCNNTVGMGESSKVYFTIVERILVVNLSYPSPDVYTSSSPLEVNQYNNFTVNATVKCQSNPAGYSCGNAYGSVRYNSSGSTMTLINTTSDTPFYIIGGGSAGSWWDTDWNYKMPDNLTNEETSSLTNFVYLANDSYIDTQSLISAGKMKSNCDDIRFINQSQNQVLAYEFENKTDTTFGCNTTQTIIWVRGNTIPTGSSNNYMYYGNSGASAGENKTGVWNHNYKGVWHLGEGVGSITNDSTSNDNDGTISGAEWKSGSNCMFGNCLHFDGTGSDYVNCSYDESLNLTDEFTIEAWFKGDRFEASGTWRAIVGRSIGGGSSEWSHILYVYEQQLIGAISKGSDQDQYLFSDGTISAGKWYYAAFTVNSTHLVLYINGKYNISDTRTTDPNGAAWPFYIGLYNPDDPATYWNGTIDEVRISNRSMTAEEINATYQALKSSFGSETEKTSAAENPQSCGSLSDGEQCNLTWTINATGSINDIYRIDVNFSSNPENNTGDAYVKITGEDTEKPKYFDNSTNSTYTGKSVEFRLRWTDNSGLSGFTFSIDNGTGTFSNGTGWQSFSGSSGEEWSNVTRVVNSTEGATIRWIIYANDTSDNWNTSQTYSFITTALPYLEVVLVEPSTWINVAQNHTFTVNATVYCRENSCGNINGTVRYNSSSLNPDKSINTTEDTPFYTMGTSNPLECPTNPLIEDEFCNVTWSVNATGDVGTDWKIGVLFESDEIEISSNHTENNTVSIVSCVLYITAHWSVIDFGAVGPSKNNSAAIGNSGGEYNLSVGPTTTCNVDLYINGSDLNQIGGSYAIGVGNTSWNTTYKSSTTKLSKSFVLLNQSTVPGTNITTYYWINTPAVAEGSYNGSVWFKGVEEGESP